MSPYARGNRDGLTSFAAECEIQALAEDARGAVLGQHRTLGERLRTNHAYAAAAWRDAARLARTAALALPDDPTPAPLFPR